MDFIPSSFYIEYVTISYAIYIGWKFVGDGHCEEKVGRETLSTNARTPEECQNKCKYDCKYVTYDPRDSFCTGQNSSACNLISAPPLKSYQKGSIICWIEQYKILIILLQKRLII